MKTAGVLRLKLEFERQEWRLVCEEAQRAHYAKKALQDAQLAAQREARDLRLAELRKACELRELEFKAEQEKALLEAVIEAKKDPARNIKLVPTSKKRRLRNILLIFRKLLIV